MTIMPKSEVPTVQAPTTEELHEAEATAEKIEQRKRELSVIDIRYGSPELPYNKDRVEGEILQIGQQIAWSFYEIGKRLILLKEHEPHGEFTAALERMGIEPRNARNWMRCALVVDKLKTETVSDLGVRKLVALGTLTDDDLEALGEGKTVAGLHLDDLDKLSYSELKTQVRGHLAELKAQEEAFGKIFEQKDKALNEKDKEILRLEKELAKPSKEALQRIKQGAIDRGILGVRRACAEVVNAYELMELAMLQLCQVDGIDFPDLAKAKELTELDSEQIGARIERLDNGWNNMRPWREGDGMSMFEA